MPTSNSGRAGFEIIRQSIISKWKVRLVVGCQEQAFFLGISYEAFLHRRCRMECLIFSWKWDGVTQNSVGEKNWWPATSISFSPLNRQWGEKVFAVAFLRKRCRREHFISVVGVGLPRIISLILVPLKDRWFHHSLTHLYHAKQQIGVKEVPQAFPVLSCSSGHTWSQPWLPNLSFNHPSPCHSNLSFTLHLISGLPPQSFLQ